ncbi:unannotated protein [freshwater metagenome]|uniref:Unannotated protein n=1 Tax=freshwater metagenome TaxID=449393 RepID=A0A6J7AEW5_9ZZZZ
MLVYRDAAAIVNNPHPSIGQQSDRDGGGVASQGFIYRVIDDLIDQVMEAALTGGADVHAWPLTDGVKALQDGDRAGVIGHGGRASLLRTNTGLAKKLLAGFKKFWVGR